MKAAALLEEAFPANQGHPGVLHYLIHAYDDPAHAPLGMRAARLYGAVAPEAGHALHMTSHIFIALGMWTDVIDANLRARDVVNRQRAARSKPPLACGHYMTWLHYGYLQTRRLDEARAMIEACRDEVASPPPAAPGERGTGVARVLSYVDMRASQAASGMPIAPSPAAKIPDGVEHGEARFTSAYVDVLEAAGRGDRDELRAAAARLRDLEPDARTSIAHDGMPSVTRSGRVGVLLKEAAALELVADGKRAAAITLLEDAAREESALAFEFGPPFVPKPAYELLGDQLLLAGRAADAEAAYHAALARAPGRTAALTGLLRAQRAAGKEAAAAGTEAGLRRYVAGEAP
jgi:hypothetical protein